MGNIEADASIWDTKITTKRLFKNTRLKTLIPGILSNTLTHDKLANIQTNYVHEGARWELFNNGT
jgi:hypothetical protein